MLTPPHHGNAAPTEHLLLCGKSYQAGVGPTSGTLVSKKGPTMRVGRTGWLRLELEIIRCKRPTHNKVTQVIPGTFPALWFGPAPTPALRLPTLHTYFPVVFFPILLRNRGSQVNLPFLPSPIPFFCHKAFMSASTGKYATSSCRRY